MDEGFLLFLKAILFMTLGAIVFALMWHFGHKLVERWIEGEEKKP